jgi:hypothetical protein
VETLRLLLVGSVVGLELLASLGPATGFFTLSTESYPFMIVLNVIFFTAGGLAGLIIIHRALGVVVSGEEVHQKSVPDSGPSPALPPSKARGVFVAWAIIYGAVGAQMG